ncbi:MAG: ABC transporter ATP-binding protein/permease [Candidatus Nomurabacteria bacterium]|nr:ABC transporter ATP-binding protein/permease [Candidatus Nomurabacteria bacterium]
MANIFHYSKVTLLIAKLPARNFPKTNTQKKYERPIMHNDKKPQEKPANLKLAIKRLLKSLAEYKFWVILTIVLAIASTVFAIVGPKILGTITTDVATALMTAAKTQSAIVFNFDSIAKTALFLLALYIFSLVTDLLSNIIMSYVTKKYTLKLRAEISQKINTLPIRYFDKHKFGDTLARVTNDVDTIATSLNQSLSQMISSVVTVVGILIMMLSISWQLTLVAIATLPLSMGFIGIITKKSQKFFKGVQEQTADVTAQAEEVYAGHSVVRAFNAGADMEKKFYQTSHNLQKSSLKSQFLSGLMHPIMNFIGNLGYVAVAIVGGGLAIDGKILLGDIQAFIQYVSQFNQPIAQVAQIANLLQSTLAASDRVFDFLEETNEPTLEEYLPMPKQIKGDIEFRNVVFQYDDADQPTINKLSFKVKAGQKVAIVGPTGAGKTTLINLLMRFYDLDSGQILLDGQDIAQMKRSDIRQQFGMVLQDTWLMSDTLRNNLRYGKPTATDAEIMEIAEAAGIKHLIESMPKGLSAQIDEDTESVSVGEKQLLTVARAMLANAPMMILDEATSNVDTRTEEIIQRAMENLTSGRTSFVIAHRLSTIRDADLILVMNHGDVIEQGTHKQLIAQGGFYADLHNSQFSEEAE